MNRPRLRKGLLVAALALIPLGALAVFLGSNPMIDVYIARADRDPESEASKASLLRIADLCSATGRPERAAVAYRRFYDRCPGDARRPVSLFQLAAALEESGRTAEAADLYEKFILEYPLREELEEARRGLNRLRPR